jgi:catechol 2,3-dioxygenase-like lactoylglutathione lyase family enzyme
MATTGLNHINFHAHRPLLDEMRDFYRDVVGLAVGPRPPFRMFGYWLYAGDLPVVHLYEAADDEVRDTAQVNTFDHIAFSATDPDAVEARLNALNVPYRVTAVPATAMKQIFVEDPAGNSVELQFPPEA